MRSYRFSVPLTAALLVLAISTPAAADSLATGSLSCGSANRGALAGAHAIPDSGEGYVAPEPWRSRGLRFATEELVGLIERAAAAVAREYAGSVLGVADLSAERGGPVPRHASHQSGRDADLIYYAIDRAGDPFPPDQYMAYYRLDGRAFSAESPEPAEHIEERYFDLPRNWALITALIGDPDVHVTRIFVSTRVRDWLLAYARTAAVPAEEIARVEAVLSTARDTGTHQDHMHVRIACSEDDVSHGRCSDAPAAPPRRRRRAKRPRPHKWYAHVRCVEPRTEVATKHPGGGSPGVRARPASAR